MQFVGDFLLALRAVFDELKKLPIAKLYSDLARTRMQRVMPCSTSSYWECSLVYWLPWSE